MEDRIKMEFYNEKEIPRSSFISKCAPMVFVDNKLSLITRSGGQMVLPSNYLENWAHFIRNVKVRSDDVWLLGMPKCGTTWAQEMTWLIGNDLDFQRAKELSLDKRFPSFERGAIYSPATVKGSIADNQSRGSTSMETVVEMPSRRFIKSHLPLSFLPAELLTKGARIVYITRNPKDACVSFFHFCCTRFAYQGSLEEFAEAYMNDEVLYTQFWTHVKTFHDLHVQNHPQVLFLTYEEMKRDLRSVIVKTARFLEKTINLDGMEKLMNHLSFENMSQNPAVNKEVLTDAHVSVSKSVVRTPFMRKGQVGTWKDELSIRTIQKFDEWMEKNQIDGGLSF